MHGALAGFSAAARARETRDYGRSLLLIAASVLLVWLSGCSAGTLAVNAGSLVVTGARVLVSDQQPLAAPHVGK